MKEVKRVVNWDTIQDVAEKQNQIDRLEEKLQSVEAELEDYRIATGNIQDHEKLQVAEWLQKTLDVEEIHTLANYVARRKGVAIPYPGYEARTPIISGNRYRTLRAAK